MLEAELVNDLFRFRRNDGEANLNETIIVFTPYIDQKELLQQYLRESPSFFSSHHRAPMLEIKLNTVDSSQSSERDAVIVSFSTMESSEVSNELYNVAASHRYRTLQQFHDPRLRDRDAN